MNDQEKQEKIDQMTEKLLQSNEKLVRQTKTISRQLDGVVITFFIAPFILGSLLFAVLWISFNNAPAETQVSFDRGSGR